MKYLAFTIVLLCSLALGAKDTKDAKKPKAGPSDASTNDPVYIEYLQLLAKDDAAEKEVDQWIKDAEAFEAAGDKTARMTVSLKVKQRLEVVKDAYKVFLEKHPKHAEARLAYGSFLMDIQDEEEGVKQLEEAREIDPKNPAAWNNLANYYGHRGPAKKAFAYYEKAMELAPDEPVYPWNFATTIYLFRKDARELYNIDEQKVFDRSMELYQRALKLDPTNLVLATDLAQSYYGIKPMRTNDALLSWTNALSLAKTSDEQQGVLLHLARVELNTGYFEEARRHLNMVTNAEMADLKTRLERNWREKGAKAFGISTNGLTLAKPILGQDLR